MSEHFDRYEAIAQQIGIDRLRGLLESYFPPPAQMAELISQDEHLNNVPLNKWDGMDYRVREMARNAKLKSWSLSDTVCTLKHVARHHYTGLLKDDPKPEPEITTFEDDPPQMSINDFITKHSLEMECRRVESRKDGLMDEKMRHFRCRVIALRVHDLGNGQMTHSNPSFGLYFSQGSAHVDAPTLPDVLDCLASDASGYENAPTFEEWAGDYGYDMDSRKAEKTYRAVKRQSEQLKRLLGNEAYQELLFSTERL